MTPSRIVRLFLSLAVAAAVAFGAAPARAHPDGTFPRTMNLDWSNDPNALRNSKYDIVSFSSRAPKADFDSVRALNPASIRLVSPAWYNYYYAGPSGYSQPYGPYSTSDPVYGFDRRFWNLLNDNNWWCWSVDSVGTRYHATAYWNMWLGNLSVKSPRNAQGKRLCDVFADFIVDDLVASKGADGVFFDQLWDSPGWLNGYMGGCQPGTNCTVQTPGTEWRTWFDLDGNGAADPPDSLDVWWKQGVEIVFQRLRQRMGPNFVIMGNGQHHYLEANGAMHERFPRIFGRVDPAPNPYNYRWQDSMFGPNGYLSAWPTLYSGPVRNLIDTELAGGDRLTYPSGSANQQLFRFNLGSALLGDGYMALNNSDYACTYWQPEYNLRLGWPTGPAYAITLAGVQIWRRDFTNGKVWVNAKGVNVPVGVDNPAINGWDAVISETAGTIDVAPGSTGGITFERARPNPVAGGATTLTFALGAGERARLEVIDARGRLVRRVWDGAGTGMLQTALWDGRTEEGWVAPAGVYFARVEGEAGRSREQKLIRTR
ncbi:MAG: putative glycoside hydrolase [Candidatus Eisenbacteria bacterium]